MAQPHYEDEQRLAFGRVAELYDRARPSYPAAAIDAVLDHGALAPGGCFVFSIEHPIYMAPSRPGWSVDAEGRRTWPVDGYLIEGPRTTDWLAKGVVKHHRTLGTTLNLLIRSGFQVEHVEEFCPSDEQIAMRPELAEELDRPTFLLVRGRRSTTRKSA